MKKLNFYTVCATTCYFFTTKIEKGMEIYNFVYSVN